MKVFIADGSENTCAALQELIAEIDGLKVAGLAPDTRGAIEGFLEQAQQSTPPEVLILNIQLADGSGHGVLQFIKRQFPATKIIMLCNCISTMYREHCTRDGADYFLDKVTEFSDVQKILRELVQAQGTSKFDVAA